MFCVCGYCDLCVWCRDFDFVIGLVVWSVYCLFCFSFSVFDTFDFWVLFSLTVLLAVGCLN